MDLYQVSLAHDGNKVESHANVFEEANAEANNALMMHNSCDPNNTNGVENSNFLKTQMVRLVLLVVVVKLIQIIK